MSVESIGGASKTRVTKSEPIPPAVNSPLCKSHGCCSWKGGEFSKRLLMTLVGILLVYCIVLLGSMIRNNLQKYFFIGRADKTEHTVTIDGQGKVTAVPDVGVVMMGVILQAPTVSEVQQKGNDTINSLITKLTALGISKADIQTTNYSIYPKIKYTQEKGEEQTGFEVNQGVTVKIRDLSMVNGALALAGQVGANNVGGVQFVLDNPETAMSIAREQALEKIHAKVKQLTEGLGVRFVDIVSYTENPDMTFSPIPYGGVGMGAASNSNYGGGPVTSGNNEIVVNIRVTYAVR